MYKAIINGEMTMLLFLGVELDKETHFPPTSLFLCMEKLSIINQMVLDGVWKPVKSSKNGRCFPPFF